MNLLSLRFLTQPKPKEVVKHSCADCIKENKAIKERLIKILAKIDERQKEDYDEDLVSMRDELETLLLIVRTRE